MARRARWAWLGLSLLLTGGAVVAPATASAAPVAPMAGPVPGASPDFDGDGEADLAAGIYLDQSDQYAVRIWYGSGAVTDVTNADVGGPVVTDGEGGLRGPLLARDFNGDGYCDLAFTIPGEHLSVVQVFGSASGLDLAGRHTTEVAAAAGDTLYAKALALVSAPKPRLAVGYSISRGESRFARVGVFDLAASGAASGTPLIVRAGAGSMPKLADWTFGSFGDALAASGNRLFVGMPLATVSGHKYAGAVVDVTMGATGVSSAKAISQSTSGVTGVAGKGDNFGGSLAAADGYLAVGAPWDDVESVKNTGSVQVFTVTSKSLTPVRRVSQYGSAVPGKAEPYDVFGYSVAFGRSCAGVVSLIVGGPGEAIAPDSSDGSVWLVPLTSARGCAAIQLYEGHGLSGRPHDASLGYDVAALRDAGSAVDSFAFAGDGSFSEGPIGEIFRWSPVGGQTFRMDTWPTGFAGR